MVDANYTHIAAVVDRSGSVAGIRQDLEGGLNSVFKEQAALPGKCLVDVNLFDDRFEVLFTDRPVSEAEVIIHPRNTTALLDAIGRTINTLGAKFAAMQEDQRPGKVLVVIVTDGLENASKEFTKANVREMIKRQEDEWQWEFLFLGTGFDAMAVGQDYGFKYDNTLDFDPKNVAVAAAAVSTYTTNTRSGLKAAFTSEERAAAKK